MINLRDPALPAAAVRAALALAPHPEGGHFREVWRDPGVAGARGAGTSILFLLAEGERSHWHRVDAAELWLWQAGAPLELEICGDRRANGGAGDGVAECPEFGRVELREPRSGAGVYVCGA